MNLFDSHCHLDILYQSQDFQNTIKANFSTEIIESGLKSIIQIAIDYPSSIFAHSISNIDKNNLEINTLAESTIEAYNYFKEINIQNLISIYYSVGMHPGNVKKSINQHNELLDFARNNSSDKKFVAIGEIGLDYYWQKDNKVEQEKVLLESLELAMELKKPVIIHSRDAFEETYRLLKENHNGNGVIHCFTGDKNWVEKFLDLGYYISFSGIVSFNSAKDIQEACKFVPRDKILVETDSPYLAPVPKRGKTNRPAFVKHTLEFVSKLKNIDVEELANQTTTNTKQLFQILT